MTGLTQAEATQLKGGHRIDFTGSVPGFRQMTACGEEFAALVRNGGKPSAVVVIDRAIGASFKEPALVSDHVNLTGTSPLIGPNHPCGERFPVVQGIYVDCLSHLSRVVVAGLKPGVVPTAADVSRLKEFGVDCSCYNLIPAMLLAAHAGWKVLGIVVPEGATLPPHVVDEIDELTGTKP